MASLVHSLSSLLFIIISTFINVNLAQPPKTQCPSFECSNGITIRYPFWHQLKPTTQIFYCGYPGFNISCNNQNAVFHLSKNHYHVKNINYHGNYLTLLHADINEATCPIIHNIDVVTVPPPFNYTLSNKLLRFFYNCTLYPPSQAHVKCLQHGAKRSYVFIEGSIPEFDWQKYCESIMTVPVINKDANNGELAQNFREALQDGFRLTWQRPDGDGACASCEVSGGFCGYKLGSQNFFCLCSDGSQHLVNCRNDEGASIQSQQSYIAIGALVFGVLMIGATVYYFVLKKRVALYKPIPHKNTQHS